MKVHLILILSVWSCAKYWIKGLKGNFLHHRPQWKGLFNLNRNHNLVLQLQVHLPVSIRGRLLRLNNLRQHLNPQESQSVVQVTRPQPSSPSIETEPVEECCPCEDEEDHHGGGGFGYKPSYGVGYRHPTPIQQWIRTRIPSSIWRRTISITTTPLPNTAVVTDKDTRFNMVEIMGPDT